jgi:hypothetical protein
MKRVENEKRVEFGAVGGAPLLSFFSMTESSLHFFIVETS